MFIARDVLALLNEDVITKKEAWLLTAGKAERMSIMEEYQTGLLSKAEAKKKLSSVK